MNDDRGAYIDSALERAQKLRQKAFEASFDVAKEKTQFFEKIALGSGAIVAAIVSFVSSQKGHLQPAWMLRCTLVVWVLAVVAAMLRNWRYQFYPVNALRRQEKQAEREAQRRDNLIIESVLNAGDLIHQQTWAAQFQKSDTELSNAIDELTEYEDSVFQQVKKIEFVTLALTVAGIIGLVAMTWINF